MSAPGRRSMDLRPDPAWYARLGGDELLRSVLDAFYDRVFVDPALAPFFARADKPTLKGKQFGFLKRCFTGEEGVYMGQRPRNAHHHMVISDAQFDHRARLMEQVLREAGLADEDVRRWLAVEEIFRQQIVKAKPWPLFYRGVQTAWSEEPRPEVLGVDGSCDRCTAAQPAGATIWVLGEDALCGGCLEGAR